MHAQITHISKLEFLSAFRTAFLTSITQKNIQGRFSRTGILPFNPKKVLSKFNVLLQTPTPPETLPITTMYTALGLKDIDYIGRLDPSEILIAGKFYRGSSISAAQLATMEAESSVQVSTPERLRSTDIGYDRIIVHKNYQSSKTMIK